jgi:hypothetical protein
MMDDEAILPEVLALFPQETGEPLCGGHYK